MSKKLMILGGLVLMFALPGMAFAATAAEAPDKTMIDDCVIKKSAVEFDHKAHVETADCGACHHTQEGLTADSTEEVEACASCHNEPEEATTPICSQMSKTKNHFHINCIGCHKEKTTEDASIVAPTKCSECHPKAE